MNPDLARRFGVTLFHQSLRPYNKEPYGDEVAIVGFDTEYWTDGRKNVLFSWQLGFENGKGAIYAPPVNAKRLFQESVRHLGFVPKKVFLVTYFITAEAQFFYNDDWRVSEYKGKYSFSTWVDKCHIVVLDLMSWFQGSGLKGVSLHEAAKLFDLRKLDFPIVKAMNAVAKREVKASEVFNNQAFRTYAINDAVVACQIWARIRHLMLDRFGVDTLQTKTAPATSAAIFRHFHVKDQLTQPWTALRKQAIASAWGGRTECFFRGVVDDAYAFDATSHHPSSVIAMGVLPTAEDWSSFTDVDKWLKRRGGVGRVQFEFPKSERYPCLPVFSDGNLIFPRVGVSECTLFEAQLAAEMDARLTLHRGFAYDTGTTILADYLSSMRQQREQASTKAEREMLKLVMNGMVGKLFQKNLSPSLQSLRDYARDHNLPLLVVMQMKGLDLPQKATVGSSFFPEWYALILGYARANISRVARDNEALMVSSDGVIVTEPTLDFPDDGIVYKRKGRGPYLAYRSKLYRIGKKKAHHAVHSPNVAAKVLKAFLDQASVEYKVTHIVKLRESLRGVGEFGGTVNKPMSISLLYDFKRRLLDDGWTEPWESREEREAFLGEREEADACY